MNRHSRFAMTLSLLAVAAGTLAGCGQAGGETALTQPVSFGSTTAAAANTAESPSTDLMMWTLKRALAAASDPRTPVSVLAVLGKAPYRQVREAVIANPSTPADLRATVQASLNDLSSIIARSKLVGKTEHYAFYADPRDAQATASAKDALTKAEADFKVVSAHFGNIPIPSRSLPIKVSVEAGIGGAYHMGCGDTGIHSDSDPQVTAMVTQAEVVEVFEDVQGKGWDCGQINGEALSRVLAFERYPSQAKRFEDHAIQAWWTEGHPDLFSNNNGTDRDRDANGAGPLFLWYLQGQLGFNWDQITAAAAPTLADTYTALTQQPASQAYSQFMQPISKLWKDSDTPTLPDTGSPFPVSRFAGL